MNPNEDIKTQLETLQTQLSYQEHTIATLNEAISGQQQEILLLRRQLELVKQRLDEQGQAPAADGADDHDEKPPHY